MIDFIEQVLKLCAEIFESIFSFAWENIAELITGVPQRKEEYTAQFASVRTLLSKRNNGFCLTGRKNLSVRNSYQNALIIGGTGVGKSSIVLLPSLFTMRSSFIIHDPSGELYTKSAGYLKQQGYETKVLNFANPAASSSYNPLARANGSSDIQKVASILIANSLGANSKDPFWNMQAVGLLSILITILKKQESEYRNLYNLRQLLNHLGSAPEKFDELFARAGDEILYAEYKSFVSYDEKVVSGIIATCKAALQIFTDESVARVTANDNLNLKDFRTKPVALYIQNSVADQRYYSVLTSLFFEQFFSFALGRIPDANERDVFLLIDEASSLNLPTLPLAVANVRKHRSGIMLIVQDFNQITEHYGRYDAESIKSNCFAKMYFTGQSLETAKELEFTLGRFQYEDKKKKTIVRPLMTSDEIRTMPATQALLICGYYPPILAKLVPYYKNRKFLVYSRIPAPVISTTAPVELSVLNLNKNNA
jgi:type IV secretion system protein VirD4